MMRFNIKILAIWCINMAKPPNGKDLLFFSITKTLPNLRLRVYPFLTV